MNDYFRNPLAPASVEAKNRNGIGEERGMSMPEVLVAAVISTVLAVVVSALILGAIAIASRSQGNMTVGIRTQNALTGFEANARDAYKVLEVSTSSISFLLQRGEACEKHDYAFGPEEGLETYALGHTILSVTTETGLSCADVASQLAESPVGLTPTYVEEINGLSSGRFSYYGADGVAVFVTGDEEYDASAVVPNCRLGAVEMTVVSVILGEGESTTLSESARAAFRTNMMGISC